MAAEADVLRILLMAIDLEHRPAAARPTGGGPSRRQVRGGTKEQISLLGMSPQLVGRDIGERLVEEPDEVPALIRRLRVCPLRSVEAFDTAVDDVGQARLVWSTKREEHPISEDPIQAHVAASASQPLEYLARPSGNRGRTPYRRSHRFNPQEVRDEGLLPRRRPKVGRSRRWYP